MLITRFSANVIPGAGRGKRMGIPTLNLELQHIPKTLDEGIYACWVILEGREKMPGALHYGQRPVFHDSRACEVHLINEVLVEHPKVVSIEIVQRLRAVQDFESEMLLIQQIREDIEHSREILDS